MSTHLQILARDICKLCCKHAHMLEQQGGATAEVTLLACIIIHDMYDGDTHIE